MPPSESSGASGEGSGCRAVGSGRAWAEARPSAFRLGHVGLLQKRMQAKARERGRRASTAGHSQSTGVPAAVPPAPAAGTARGALGLKLWPLRAERATVRTASWGDLHDAWGHGRGACLLHPQPCRSHTPTDSPARGLEGHLCLEALAALPRSAVVPGAGAGPDPEPSIRVAPGAQCSSLGTEVHARSESTTSCPARTVPLGHALASASPRVPCGQEVSALAAWERSRACAQPGGQSEAPDEGSRPFLQGEALAFDV